MDRFGKKNAIFLFFAAGAALLLALASRSSFLYPFNNWDDANSYLTMGKALFHGKVLYRDVFDQKGMYLYFLYGLAYLVSHTTFAGVFLLELILAVADIFGFYRILELFLDRKGISAILAPVPFAALISSRSFWWGGAAEEICLPFLIWGLFLFLRYFKTEYPRKQMALKTVFAGGILAGIIANIKFTLLGFFFAWMMCVGISYLLIPVSKAGSALSGKDAADAGSSGALRGDFGSRFLSALRACGVFLFGMFLPFLPWIVYFGLHHALYEWYWGYVYVNVFLYSEVKSMGSGLFEKCYSLLKLLYNLIRANMVYFVPAIPGIIYTMTGKGVPFISRIGTALLFAFLYLGIFGGGRELPYYALPLGIFGVLGAALAGRIILWAREHIGRSREGAPDPGEKKEPPENKSCGWILILSAILLTAAEVLLILTNSMNIPYMKQKKEDLFLYRFRDRVLLKEDPTLLNVGCLDAGLYTLCDIVPNCRYFQTQTLHVPDKKQDPYFEQERYIEEGLTDFVIARDEVPAEIEDHYELIDSEDTLRDGLILHYYLYEKTH
ncbi:MAG: hypothetical protein K6F53_00515 [Lachnospiraceae bacterium]|nr:hypothetical protein [Lachnospiraceae bacterium]